MKHFLLTALIVMVTVTGWAKHEGGYLHNITMNYKTDHLNWSENLVGGKINTLFIISRKGGREVVEAAQRIPLNFNAVALVNARTVAVENIYEGATEGTSMHDKTQELIRAVDKKYELIVIGNFNFDILPAEVQFKILKQVMAGTGLVIVYPFRTKFKKVFSNPIPGAAAQLLKGIPLTGLPAVLHKIDHNTLLKTYIMGKGRIATIDYKDPHSSHYQGMTMTVKNLYSDRWQAEYENNILIPLRAMAWASRRFKTGLKQFKFSANSADFRFVGMTENAKLIIRVRNVFNDIVFSITKFLQTGSVSCQLPVLPGGDYYVDYRVQHDGRELTFGSRAINIASPVGTVKVASSSEYYPENASFRAAMNLEKALPQAGSVTVELIDSPYGRVWFKKQLPLRAGIKKLTFDISNYAIPTIAGYLRCTINKNGSPVALGKKLLFFPKRKIETYMTLGWDALPNAYLGKFYAGQIVDTLRWRAGLAHPTPGATNARAGAMLDARIVPYMVRIGLKNNKGKTEQYSWFFLPKDAKPALAEIKTDQSFNNPKVRKLWQRGIKHRMQNLTTYGPVIYNLGDENFFSYDSGFSPSDTAAFTAYIKARYKTISALNKEWGTSYNSFTQVKHFNLKEAKNKKLYAAWFDHRKFMEKQYADMHHFLAAEIKKYDPVAVVGAEGSVPGDLEQTISKLDFWGPYSNLVGDELLRSLAPEKIRMLWWGGYVGSHGGRGIYPMPLWKDLLSGNVNGNAWFSASVASSESAIGADMDFPGYVKKLMPHLNQLRDGLAQLLITTPLRNDGIAILSSHASNSAKFLDERCISPSDSAGEFIQFCYRNGLNIDFVTARTINQGALKNKKILFLFGASALSAKECAAIEKFADNSGTVVADMNPAIMNDYLRVLNQNPLQSLFGNILFSSAKQPALTAVKVETKINKVKLHFNALKALSTPGAKIMKIRKVGKGRAILLNFTLSAAASTANKNTPSDEFLASLLKTADITPPVKITGLLGRNQVIRVRQANGIEVVGILADKNDLGQKATFAFGRKVWIYESGKGLVKHAASCQAEIKIPLKILCLFDTKQTAANVTIDKSQITRGDKVKLDLSQVREGAVLLLQIKAPNGKLLSLRRRVIVNNSTADTVIPFAYNDTVGTYSLILTDIATALKKTIKITLN
jgi:glycosyl hydrolase family 42 (putative beta-galactosidase)